MIRRAETDADLAAYAACWETVWPADPISVDFIRERISREPERLYLLAEDGPRVVATGCVARSSRSGVRPVAVAVVPERRRNGLGGKLLQQRHLAGRARGGVCTVVTPKPIAGLRPGGDQVPHRAPIVTCGPKSAAPGLSQRGQRDEGSSPDRVYKPGSPIVGEQATIAP